jgi:hypothetical protein
VHFKLNGWQRLGVVVSALWAIWPFLYEGTSETSLPEAFRSPDCYVIALGPILLAWPLAYIAVYTFKWVKRGFQSTPVKVQAAPKGHTISEANKSAPRQIESVPHNNPPEAIPKTDILADDLSLSFRSLKVRWIVCLVSAILFSIFRLSDGVSLLMLLFALIGFVYSISCIIRQMKILRNLKGKGVQANYWYVLMLVGLLFLFYGIVIEVGCFLLYGRGINRRLAHPATSR